MEIKLLEHLGSDYTILRAARVSTGNDASKGDKKDRGLIRYLYRNEHLSPFEMTDLIWYVKCPIFVARQFFRHRTFSFNEVSGRYKKFEWETFSPNAWRKQDTENRQGSFNELDSEDTRKDCDNFIEETYSLAEKNYNSLLDSGVAREQARMIMPVGHYTEFYVKTDLRNLFHFLELRTDSHAQKEIQDVANEMLRQLKELNDFKWSVEIFEEMRALKETFKKLCDNYKSDLYFLNEKLEEM